MKRRIKGIEAVLTAGLFCTAAAWAQDASVRQGPRPLEANLSTVGKNVLGLKGRGIDGRDWSLQATDKPTVIALTNTTCPVTKKYSPVLARIEEQYKGKVDFVFVNPSFADPAGDMAANVQQHGFDGPYLHDPSGKFVSTLKAQTTTDVFVITGDGEVAYRGAVSDQYGLGYSLNAAKKELLKDAIDAVLAGVDPEVTATWAPGCVLASTSEEEIKAVSYAEDVAKIVQEACVDCPRPGGVGTFRLDSYEQVKDHAGMVRYAIENRIMPPWFAADPGQGEHSPWKNDLSLSEEQIKTIQAWMDADMPEGDPTKAPKPKPYADGWSLGKPDVVYQLPREFKVKGCRC
jgi:thiol-disulfide isomerase/thioredoxin